MAMNTLNIPAVDRAAQTASHNAMNMEQAEQKFREEDRVANTKWLLAVAQNGMNMLEQNPEQLRSYLQAMDKDGQRRGMWPKLGIEYENMGDEELLQAAGEGFENMGQGAHVGLAGMQQPKRERYKDANDYNRYADTNERVNPDLVKDSPGATGVTGSLQELEARNAYNRANGLPEINPTEHLRERRQNSASMQAYNQYLSQVPEGQTPLNETDYAALRVGNIAEAKSDVAVTQEFRSLQTQNRTAYAAYEVARNGLMVGLAGTDTGYWMGKIPPMTAGQQLAEGGVAGLRPILKNLFREAGEGVFTDADQRILNEMVPSRETLPEVRLAIMENIDLIIRAKLRQDDMEKIEEAREAIRRGADEVKIRERLESLGIDPRQL